MQNVEQINVEQIDQEQQIAVNVEAVEAQVAAETDPHRERVAAELGKRPLELVMGPDGSIVTKDEIVAARDAGQEVKNTETRY